MAIRQSNYRPLEEIIIKGKKYIKGSPIGFRTFKTETGFDNPAGKIAHIIHSAPYINIIIEKRDGSSEACFAYERDLQ
jgi:hypothetical protein